MTRETLNKAWRDFLVDIMGLPIAVKYNQNAPLPTEAMFATIQITPSQDIGWNSVLNKTDQVQDIDEVVIGERYYFANINFFKKSGDVDAFDFADQLKMYVQSTAGYEFLSSRGVAYTSQGDVQDITAVESGLYEQRALLRVQFNAVNAISSQVLEIESATFEGELQDVETIYNIETTVNKEE